MFDKIIAYSIKHKSVIILLVVALIFSGIYSLKNLPIDALPDITNNQVQILTTAPNLATQEVELFITYPIELAIKAIPKIVELRSVSRFGLSIVTVVFEENVDIYWARTQINERLKIAEDQIPKSFGTPELAPISTGLGEIFQYTVNPKPGYEEDFDIMELRSIQDWIIVPQLLGVRGVAEVNTLGGILKEYEVAVNPDQLKSMNVTMAEIFEALSHNNENTGGAYIDKKPYAYFIRSIGMISSLNDVGKIVIKTVNNIPILIRDVAEVKFGNTVRYGATTKDGKGETVNGMVMMLKGENSAEIVSLVKDKMKQIEPTLPEGVQIEPYLDRSKLVDKAISTVRTNLIEGALIVIFILVLLIGNWRAGMIVATVIPLSLLFAVNMMRIFGVSGNLMSLGAIDFGLIVDGAVIIVESIVHRLQNRKSQNHLSREEMDHEVYTAASKIRNSAAFGEIIILIVYLPILVLVGIEGKMFMPMAQTVSFAILGAFILSLTYVPMMSALFLNRNIGMKDTISDRIIGKFQRVYTPVLDWAMQAKSLVLSAVIFLFLMALITFIRLGGEFIPTLEEGDIATHVIIPPGSSLEQEIQTTLKAERLLLENFPEIEQVVSKIGSAEVPTDPMPMEVADVMVIMKDKKEWTTAKSKEEMFEKMEKVLDELPGVTTEFSQPIQMRFNELMTGIRSDVGVKIFGENIDLLVELGDQAVSIINEVEGVKDCRAEAVSGLPQIMVRYDKDKLALYGLHVGDLNNTLSMGFAGKKAGDVYEGEEKYDLVVRLDEPFRQDISNVRNLYITLPTGNQITLDQVADIKMERGPAQISREDGKRRIIIGFNVRDRDVETVVAEIKKKLSGQMELPVGYYINYAGQFENLKRAKERLSIAVPMALALIFVLLFFTFKSIKQSIMIFTAIPLSAIGGVFALWLRDMPFSISAGVGFIALFGVAVLNGIVLISYFNRLKKDGMTDIRMRINKGTQVRLRPVIMTAAVASFGFLPMALSTSAGAEVQKPLATVVIGGLITATVLTLIILPILYYYSETKVKVRMRTIGMFLLMITFGSINILSSQSGFPLSQSEYMDRVFSSNLSVLAAKIEVEKYQELKEHGYVIPKTEFEANIGQMNSRLFDQSYSLSQSFNPYISKAYKALNGQSMKVSETELLVVEQQLNYSIHKHWNDLEYWTAMKLLYEEQEVAWSTFYNNARIRFESGEASKIEMSSASLKHQDVMQNISKCSNEIELVKRYLGSLVNTTEKIEFEAMEIERELLTLDHEEENPILTLADNKVELLDRKKNLYLAERKVDFKIGYFIQSFQGEQVVDGEVKSYSSTPQFHGMNIGIGIPLFNKASNARAGTYDLEQRKEELGREELKVNLDNKRAILLFSIETVGSQLDYFESTGLQHSEFLVAAANEGYLLGELGYVEYMQALNTKTEMKIKYLGELKVYNEHIYALKYLLNN